MSLTKFAKTLAAAVRNFIGHTSSTPMRDPWAMPTPVAIVGADADPYGGLPFDHPVMVEIRARLAAEPEQRRQREDLRRARSRGRIAVLAVAA